MNGWVWCRASTGLTRLFFVYLAKLLILPPGGNFFLIIAGLVISLRFRRAGRILVVAGGVSLFLLCMPGIAAIIAAPLERIPVVSTVALGSVDAVVVLAASRDRGAPEYGGDTIAYRTLGRVRYAAKLVRDTGLPLLVSGGTVFADEDQALADLMAEALSKEFGVEPRWIERQSRNTAENARFSAAILAGANIRRVALVTDAMHMRRARMSFARYGMDIVPAPTVFMVVKDARPILADWLPSVNGLSMSYYALHEYLGRLFYAWRYGMSLTD